MARVENHLIKRVVLCAVTVIILASQSANADYYFCEPSNLGPVVNSGLDQTEPSISGDGLSLYFSQGTFGASGFLYVTTRPTQDADWGIPVKLGAQVQSSFYTGGQHIAPDELTLYYGPVLPGELGGDGDLWMITRPTENDPWGSPVNLGEPVSSVFGEWAPSLSDDCLSICFMSMRPGGRGNMDLWMSTRPSQTQDWQTPLNLGPSVNSGEFEGHPSLSANGRVLFFQSTQGGYGSYDVLMTTCTADGNWSMPHNLGPVVNSSVMDGEPSISPDGSTLYFTSTRPGGYGNMDLWEAAILPVVDFNQDYRVDIKDLQILIEHWGQNEPSVDMAPTPWGDGIVDGRDLEAFMSHWGQALEDPHFLAHWKVDEIEGNVAHDSVADNDALVMGEALWLPDSGHADGAVQLDGIGDYLETPFVLNPKEGVFSVFVWVKGGAPGQVVLSQVGGVNWLASDEFGYLTTDLIGEGRYRGKPLHSETVITDGLWHRIGLVWDCEYRSLYVDDELVAIDVIPQSTFPSVTGGLFLGANNTLDPGTFWLGLMDDVQIYDRVVEP